MKFLPIALLIFITVNGQSRFIPHYAAGDSNWVYMIDSNEYRWYPLYYTPRQDSTRQTIRQKWAVQYGQYLQWSQAYRLDAHNDSANYKRCLFQGHIKRDSTIYYDNARRFHLTMARMYHIKADSMYHKIDSLNAKSR